MYQNVSVDRTPIYVRAVTSFGVEYTRTINRIVCGFQTISLAPGASLSYLFNLGIGDQAYNETEYSQLFTSSNLDCPVTQFSFVNASHDSVDAPANISANGDLVISTSASQP